MSVPSLVDELTGAQLGDKRLNARMLKIVAAFQETPDASYPDMFSEAELEGAYRFLRNDKVDTAAILQPHFDNTVRRALAVESVLVLHDSSDITHAAASKGKDFYALSSKTFGYVAHVSLCVEAETGLPFGVVNLELVDRDDTLRPKRQAQSNTERWKDPKKESLRWWVGAREARKRLGREVIHVMDREGDNYELLVNLVNNNHHFVIRNCHDRVVIVDAEQTHLQKAAAQAAVVVERNVRIASKKPLSSRGKKNPGRTERIARLAVTGMPMEVVRPSNLPGEVQQHLKVNVVVVKEIEPPEGEPPVAWTLYTTESIASVEQILRVVDIYRKRWIIEEFFKAIKTGCAFSDRQLESQQTSQVALALTLPTAWRLLLIRALARVPDPLPAATALSAEEQCVLAALLEKKVEAFVTARDVYLAIAKLGGHLKSNGEPGWQILGRGYRKLQEAIWAIRMFKQASEAM